MIHLRAAVYIGNSRSAKSGSKPVKIDETDSKLMMFTITDDNYGEIRRGCFWGVFFVTNLILMCSTDGSGAPASVWLPLENTCADTLFHTDLQPESCPL